MQEFSANPIDFATATNTNRYASDHRMPSGNSMTLQLPDDRRTPHAPLSKPYTDYLNVDGMGNPISFDFDGMGNEYLDGTENTGIIGADSVYADTGRHWVFSYLWNFFQETTELAYPDRHPLQLFAANALTAPTLPGGMPPDANPKDTSLLNIFDLVETTSPWSDAYRVERPAVFAGVNPANLSVRGYGESRPVASNVTEAGQAQNRRVELRVLDR